MGAFSTHMMLALSGVAVPPPKVIVPVKRKRGRPKKARRPTTILGGKSRRPRGRPLKFTPDVDTMLLDEVDRRKAHWRSNYDEELSDSQALRDVIIRYGVRSLARDGVSRDDAIRQAKAVANGPHFRHLRVRLSKLRSKQKRP
jgi:hypothetical protein